jgi:hypothetical protein
MLSALELKAAGVFLLLLVIGAAAATFIVHERNLGKATVVAGYTKAAAVEDTRQSASLEDTQKQIQVLTARLAQTRKARDVLAAKNAVLSHTLDGAGCLSADGVRTLDRLH